MNNRQAGRRRGRGGQRQGGNPGRPDNGNRIDNRARGNAAQLLEKYKSLASDAQRSGDRVNTEYYLQFADHYFRVLGESRARFEENNRRPRDDGDDYEEDYGYEGEAVTPAAHGQQGNYRDDDREPRQDREVRQDREPRREREGRDRDEGARDGNRRETRGGYDRDEPRQAETREPRPMPANDAAEDEVRAEPRRRGRPRREVAAEPEGFDVDRLPPSLGTEAPAGEAAEERPRRGRPRRVRPDDEAIPPAA